MTAKTEQRSEAPDAYLIEYREITEGGTKRHVVTASLEPCAPTIFADDKVESRELLKVTSLYAAQPSAREACSDCFRFKARNANDCAAGDCPKWWAVRDKEAEKNCKDFRNKAGYWAPSAREALLRAAEKCRELLNIHPIQVGSISDYEDRAVYRCIDTLRALASQLPAEPSGYRQALEKLEAAWEAFQHHDGDKESGDMEYAIDAIRAILAQVQEGESAPKGWRLVPAWMLEVENDPVGHINDWGRGRIMGMNELRRAMLAAAPSQGDES